MLVSMSANGYGSPRCVGWQCPHDVVWEDVTGTVQERVALVTGANRGLGLEVSRQLVEQGFWVCLGVRDLAKGEQAAKAIGNQTRALALDVANASAARGAVREIERGYGRLDVLINNAAIHDDSGACARSGLDDHPRGVRNQSFRRLARRGRMRLLASGHGRLVNVSSGAGALASMGAGTPAYSVTKTALNALTRILAVSVKSNLVRK
jgi:NAD(P)-dependent dehydrogenase (short-subunit alcohol dehydrogenase family)